MPASTHLPENPLDSPSAVPRRSRRKFLVWIASPLCVVGALIGLVWSMTEPLVANVRPAVPSVESTPKSNVAETPAIPSWPETPLSGLPAKVRLLEVLKLAEQRLNAVDDYTATFRKQERIKGDLRPIQTIAIKLRNHPFAIYMKFLAPKAGKEAIYGVGLHDGKVIAHNGDWTRRLIPRLAVAPTDPIALADNRHPITEAGLHSLTHRLVAFRELDLKDAEAGTLLDRVTDEEGKEWLRSVHTHLAQNAERPFYRVEVLYDPETFIPHKITSYDWPAPADGGSLSLAESYEYDDLNFKADLTDRDFDITNPDYEFTRF
jgi:hypothetical protein